MQEYSNKKLQAHPDKVVASMTDLFTDNLMVSPVKGQKWVTGQQTVISSGGHHQGKAAKKTQI